MSNYEKRLVGLVGAGGFNQHSARIGNWEALFFSRSTGSARHVDIHFILTSPPVVKMFRIILVLTFLGPLNAAVFRVGWLSSSCLTFSAAGARDMTQNTLNVGQLDVKVTGSGNKQGTSGVRSVDTLAKYIDMSWGMLLKRIKEEGLLEGHTLE